MTYVCLFSIKKIIFEINNSQILLYLSNSGYWACMDHQNSPQESDNIWTKCDLYYFVLLPED